MLVQIFLPEIPDIETTIGSTRRENGLIMWRPLNLKWPVKKLESDREVVYSGQNIVNLMQS